MESLKRPPTKAEAILAVALALIAASAFVAVAYFLWFIAPDAHPISLGIFTTLSLASIFILYRAAFTSRRALSKSELAGLAWFLIAGGALGVIASLLFASGFGRGSLFATSLPCLLLGLVTLRRRDG